MQTTPLDERAEQVAAAMTRKLNEQWSVGPAPTSPAWFFIHSQSRALAINLMVTPGVNNTGRVVGVYDTPTEAFRATAATGPKQDFVLVFGQEGPLPESALNRLTDVLIAFLPRYDKFNGKMLALKDQYERETAMVLAITNSIQVFSGGALVLPESELPIKDWRPNLPFRVHMATPQDDSSHPFTPALTLIANRLPAEAEGNQVLSFKAELLLDNMPLVMTLLPTIGRAWRQEEGASLPRASLIVERRSADQEDE